MRLFTLSIIHFLLISCHQGDGQARLSPNDFESKLNSKPGELIDVRTPDEFNLEHIAHAKNLDIYSDKFESEVSKLDKNKTYYLYCQRGGRSSSAYDKFKKAGFHHVFELEGGIVNWQKEGKPIEKGNLTPSSEMNAADYNALIRSQKLVVVDFGAKWCGPCKILSPMLEKIGKSRPNDVKVIMIDVDANQTITQLNSIDELPTLAWYKNGKLVLRMIGLRSEKEINETIDQYLKD